MSMNALITHQGIDNAARHPKSWPQVAIIVLNWNGWRDTIECLESLQRLTYPSYQIIVVDNESTDGSVEKIKAWARGEIPVESKFFDYDPRTKPVRWIEYDKATAETGGVVEKESTLDQLPPNRRLVLIRSGKNLGIAGGYNVGIRYALGQWFEYIWVMNNDTVVDPSCVDLCVRTFDSNQRIGVVGPKILWYDDSLRIWYAGAQFKLWRGDIADLGRGELDGDKFSGIRTTDFVSGCALLARRESFEEVGLFDEDYFAIHEDVDWSCRVKRTSRFTLAVNLDAQVWHKTGGISTSGKVSPASAYFANKHRFLVVSRHGSWLEKLSFAVFYVFSRPTKFLLLLLNGKKVLVRAELKAVLDFWAGRYGLSDREIMNSWRRR
jgi:GT2 family glycosyltransferase